MANVQRYSYINRELKMTVVGRYILSILL